jgi:sugar phosphate isomerase/epimerase
MSAPIAVQLYTLRDSVGADPGAVLDRLAAKGFVGVESAGLYGLEPSQFAKLLGNAGLVLCSAHVGIDARNEEWSDIWAADLDAHQGAGADTVVIPMLFPNHFADPDAVKRSADLVNAANEIARSRGITLGYHNHFWEFADLDGTPALVRFFEHCDPTVIAEVDIYWATVGGADPVRIVRDLGARARLLHVKDGPADKPESDMVAVGSGAIPIADVLAAGDNVTWHIVELDRCATDMFQAVEASHDFLVSNRLARGRA